MSLVRAALMLKDSLYNFVSGLGTQKDPRSWTQFTYQELDRNQLEQMYRSDWLARRIVDLPADDATREWRQWTADRPKLEKIDALERKLELQKKLRQALIRARLYGGGALVLGVDQGNPQDELQLDDVGKDDLKFVVVCNRYELAAGPRIYNVDSPYYTRPSYYTVATPVFGFTGEQGGVYPANAKQAGAPAPSPYTLPPTVMTDPVMLAQGGGPGMVQVHPSRVIEFAGNELPDWRLAPMGGGWGDSILQTVEDSLKDFAMIMGGLASMINDMKMDVVSIPELSRKLSTADMTQKTLQRFGLANMAKSSINTLLLDKDEEWQRIQTNFGSTPELIRVAMQVASAAGGVPESRLMGNAPAKGLDAKGASGGEVDIRNYYDDIASNQKSKYKPALLPLDVCIQRSALGSFDPAIDYEWNPLYQPDPAQLAQVSLLKAQATQVYVNAGLINEDALRESVISQLTEDKVYPGLEDALDEYGSEPEEPPQPQMQLPPNAPPGMMPKGQFEANPYHLMRAQAAQKAGQPIRVPPNRKPGPPQFHPLPPGAQGAQPPGKKKIGDFNPYHDPKTGEFTTGGSGGGAGGDFLATSGAPVSQATGGVSNYGLVPGDVAKYKALKDRWAAVNNSMLPFVDRPDSPEAKAKLDQMESIVKEMHALHADPGTAAGIGLPGGPRDVTIVGAGPGGLQAGIFGGLEGLDTLIVDGNTVPGGQAKFSSRIENYAGFPMGVSGEKLAGDMYKQATRVGAEAKLGSRVIDLSYDPDTGMKHLTLANGEHVDSRTVILAGGVEFRHPTFPGSEGPGLVVGDGKELTKQATGGEAVVVGGSNGAAQAALGAALKADHVSLLSRSPVAKGMSDYQISALENHPKITVMEGETVAAMNRDASGRPTSVTTASGKTLPTKAAGFFIGSVPETDWLEASGIHRDKAGRIPTSATLETNIPGVFAIGDMRSGAIGRVGVATGEGQLALRESHVYLDRMREEAAHPHVHDEWIEDADAKAVTDALITRLFDLDRANPWFGQTVEGVKPGQTEVADYSPDQPRDDVGKWTSGEALVARLPTIQRGDFGSATAGATHADIAMQAARASRRFFTSKPVRNGIAATVAGMALESTAAVGHEALMHTLKKGTEMALDYAVGTVGSHLLVHAGALAAGGLASTAAPVAIAIAAGIATHKLATHAGITEENSRKVLAKTARFLVDHYHQLARGDYGPLYSDAAPDDVVLEALKLLVPHWEGALVAP